MRCIQLELTIPGQPAADVYRRLADFRRYPEFSSAVRSVNVTGEDSAQTVSRWEVAFRRGLLRWVEEDTFDAQRHRIDFRQLQGDLAVFDGSWSCVDVAEGTTITFKACLDMGIPSLADALEPIAVRALVDNTAAIVSGLFGGRAHLDRVIVDGVDQTALAQHRQAAPPGAQNDDLELREVAP